MDSRSVAACTFLILHAAALPSSASAACDVRSGPRRAALIELYTSEGCSSCPPADRQLSRLRETLDPAAVAVPMALHVDYWDSIGWKDPYAQAVFGERHRSLVQANRHTVVYTPHYFVGGAELRSWHGALRAEVRRINSQATGADIRVKASPAPGGTLALAADATVPADAQPAVLHVAVTESGLASKVERGENAGTTLAHDHVVRQWIGPFPLNGGTARAQRRTALPPAWNRARLDVVAFVADPRSGAVLQAVSAHQCARS